MADSNDCSSCRLAQLAGVGSGSFCPLIRRTYAAGETLFEASEAAERVWLIREGRVRIGSKIRTAGSIIGVDSLRDSAHSTTAVAEEPTVVCEASRDGFIALLERPG